MMNQEDLKHLMKNYLKENLRIEARKEGGLYGSSTYTLIELKIDGETISEAYIDESQ